MPTDARVVPARFYRQATLTVARELLGKVLVHDGVGGRSAGIIVESEAYVGEDDPACHASRGPTARNLPLYGPPGRAYVYLNYGMHWLVNAVTEREGKPAAVLVRALEPVAGLPLMRERRAALGFKGNDEALCRGPGNLTRALGISAVHNEGDLETGALRIEDWGYRAGPVRRGPRIGIRAGTERPWRFWVAGSACVSGKGGGSGG